MLIQKAISVDIGLHGYKLRSKSFQKTWMIILI